MTDAGQITIRKQETQPSKTNGAPPRASKKSLGMKMIRPLTYFFVGLLILFVGWGAWSYFGSRPRVDEGDSIADLDAIEFPSTSIDSSKASKPGSSVPVRMASATGTASERSITSGTKDQSSVNGSRSAAVWLTGTIEEIDRKDSVGAARRISGGPNESTNLR